MSTSRSNRPASSRSPAATRPRTAWWAKSRSASATCSAADSSHAPRVTYGQRTRGFELSFAEPYFLDYRLAFGVDIFAKQTDSSSYYVYRQETIGGGLRFGIPLREDLGLQLRYSVYRQQIELDQILRNCNNINPNFGLIPGAPGDLSDQLCGQSTPATTPPPGYGGLTNCYADGEASAADQAAGRRRSGARLAGRLRPRLQHARQQQEPDARPARRVAPGLRRRRRRRELHPHHRRGALSTTS